MSRFLTRGLNAPTILAALFWDWGQVSVLTEMHRLQQTPESTLLMQLYTAEMARRWQAMRAEAKGWEAWHRVKVEREKR